MDPYSLKRARVLDERFAFEAHLSKRSRPEAELPLPLPLELALEHLVVKERDFEPAISKQRRDASQQVPRLFKACTRERSPGLTWPATPQQRLEPLRPSDVAGLHRVRTGQPAAPSDDLVACPTMSRRTAHVASTWFRRCCSCGETTCFVKDGSSVCCACWGQTVADAGVEGIKAMGRRV